MHEALRGLDFHAFNELGIFRAAEREHGEHMRAAAIKDAGAVEHGRYATRLSVERAELVHSSAVRAAAILYCFLMNKVVNFFVKIAAGMPRIFGRERFFRKSHPFSEKRMERFFPLVSIGISEDRFIKLRRDALGEKRNKRTAPLLSFDRPLFFSERGDNCFLKRLNLFYFHGGGFKERNGVIFPKLVCADLNHGYRAVFSAYGCVGNDVAIAACRVGGVYRKPDLPHFSNPHGGDGSSPRDIGCCERERGGVYCDHIRVVLVYREDGDDNLHIVSYVLFKKRADGAVYHAAGKDCLVRRAPLAPHEARAQDFSGGVKLFFVINGK